MSRDFTHTLNHYLGPAANTGRLGALGGSGAPFTVSCHAQLDSLANGFPMFVTKSANTATTIVFELRIDNATGANQFVVGNASTWDVLTGHAIPRDGSWQWVACRKASGTMSVFGDHGGAPHRCDHKASALVTASNAQPLHIGTRNTGDHKFDGRLCEVAVWDVGLTDEECFALGYGVSPLLIRAASLVAYWPVFGLVMPEPDLSGNGFHITSSGTTPPAVSYHAPVGRLVPLAG